MSYKIIYHCGKEISIKTKVKNGRLELSNDTLFITGKENISIPINYITEIDKFRLHGLGRMLKILYKDKIIYLTVVRFCLFNLFAMVNFIKTGELYKKLEELINTRKD